MVNAPLPARGVLESRSCLAAIRAIRPIWHAPQASMGKTSPQPVTACGKIGYSGVMTEPLMTGESPK
jgi:hypothetical protein